MVRERSSSPKGMIPASGAIRSNWIGRLTENIILSKEFGVERESEIYYIFSIRIQKHILVLVIVP